MKITDYKNEEAVDLLADIMEPTARILGDKKIVNAVKGKANRIKTAKIALKNHPHEVIEILARIDGVKVEEFNCNPVTILAKLLELLNDKELSDFFISQGQMTAHESSTSATESTEASGQ